MGTLLRGLLPIFLASWVAIQRRELEGALLLHPSWVFGYELGKGREVGYRETSEGERIEFIDHILHCGSLIFLLVAGRRAREETEKW